MAGIRTDNVPQTVDGPSLVAAAAGLMLLPENASRLVRLHRLAALGMALPARDEPLVRQPAVQSLLRRDDIGGPEIAANEDAYSEVLVQSLSFTGGPYLVSPGSGEHTVADLENLIDALFRDPRLPNSVLAPARQVIQGLLTVSNIVLNRAGLSRGTSSESRRRASVSMPNTRRMKALREAAFVSNADLDTANSWLRTVVDSFALDPGELSAPCERDLLDDRLYAMPFLRLAHGYQVVLPLDLLITIRFHVLRYMLKSGHLEEIGTRWRSAALYRFMRATSNGSSPILLEQGRLMDRYLVKIDKKRDVHLILATDPLDDWQPDEVWGNRDTRPALDHLADLISPESRTTYSSAQELVHLVINDSPGRGAFWGVPNVDGADPMLIASTDEIEVIMHQEPDGLIGLMLFAQATERRSGRSFSTGILDEYCSYADHSKSFYFSDDRPPTGTFFEPGDGLYPRRQYQSETDRHGVIPPIPNPPILQATRRYRRDAPEIFMIEPGSPYAGYVVELDEFTVFITVDRDQTHFSGAEPELLECVAFWVRECTVQLLLQLGAGSTELIVALSDPEAWTRGSEHSTSTAAVLSNRTDNGLTLEFTTSFAALLEDPTNVAERELVKVILTELFGIDDAEFATALDAVAPIGLKRMLSVFNQATSPDMLARRLPRPLTGHEQVTARVLDELGEWLRSPSGRNLSAGQLVGQRRSQVLNDAVDHLFRSLEETVELYGRHFLLDFLIGQNEALVHDARFASMMLQARLECFGERADTVEELVQRRKDSVTAQRANRFLIEYVAAQPPSGTVEIENLDYLRLLAVASEIIERATTSDFLHYELADFEVSILASGRLGVSRDEPITTAMTTYAENFGKRSIRRATEGSSSNGEDEFDLTNFISQSEPAMRAEFGFTLTELREVCGGLLDLATADQVTRIDRTHAVSEIASARSMSAEAVSTVIDGITLSEREAFLSIGPDALPWRFNRDMSYVRRPLVQQDEELVFGFRSIYTLGPYWVDNLLSARLQGRAKSSQMRRCISEARREINDAFAFAVSVELQRLGMTTRVSVNKIGKNRIVDVNGNDLGDVDVLAAHPETKSIVAVEAKDFEIARTPAELKYEIEKLFVGKDKKKPTVDLHSRRIEWLRQHLHAVVASLGIEGGADGWRVSGVIVTSEPLVTPLATSTAMQVLPFDDLSVRALGLKARTRRSSPSRRKKRGNR